MATVNLGRIKPIHKGEYSGATAYKALDIVSYGPDSYVALQNTTGNLPTNATYFGLIANVTSERTNAATLTNKTLTSPDINGGTVDGAVIGGAVPAAGTFTNLSASGNITGGGPTQVQIQPNGRLVLLSPDANDNMVIRAKGNGKLLLNYGDGSGGVDIYNGTTGAISATVTSTGLNNTVIGAATPAAGSFTTLSASGQVLIAPTVGTSAALLKLTNTGGDYFVAVDSSVGNSFGPGTPYGLVQYVPSGKVITTNIGGLVKTEISSTGLSVTGGISAINDDVNSPANINISSAFGSTPAPAYQNLNFKGYQGNRTAVIRSFDQSTSTASGGGLEFLVNPNMATDALTSGMRLSADGNLGLGVVPSAWGGTWKSMQIGIVGSIAAQTNTTAIHVSSNEYINSGGTSTYIADDFASKYRQISGTHSWHTAPSGTAGQPISFPQAMTLDASGNLLLGATIDGMRNADHFSWSTSNKAVLIGHISGTASSFPYAYFGYDSNVIGSITQSGTTAVLYNTSSDARLKTNITNASDASSLIDALQVRQFDWKSDGSHQRYGFVAQELYEVAPEAVSKPQDPEEMMAVDYSKLVPMLVKEIQSMRQRIAQLEGI